MTQAPLTDAASANDGGTVLVTGAFGNVGLAVVEALVARGHRVRCFELPTRRGRRCARRLGDAVEVIWGDLRDAPAVERAARGVAVVVHMAFVLPPASERDPEAARAVNVGGTANVVAAARAQVPAPRLLFCSSYHVHRYRADRTPPIGVDEPVEASDHYAGHKIEAERVVRESGLGAAVLRLSSVLTDRSPDRENLRIMFDIPLDTRFELVHLDDAGVAFANAVARPAVDGKVLFVGGGPRCQTTYRDFYARVFEAFGLDPLPESAFRTEPPFIGDWLDTTESQRLLEYQRHGIDDWIEPRRARGLRRALTRAVAPLVRRWMVGVSPYFR